ncbi:MAG TPA: DsbA family protein [Longimicrobium sp.]|nr:DsbA family protein [Longimicrobium sp.]
MAPLPATVLTDFTCPFSYVTEAALARVEDEGAVAAGFRAFELHPAPARLPLGGPEVEAVRPLAEALGLGLRRPVLAARTRKAHELARFGEGKGVGRPLRAAIFAAYFGAGRDIGRIDVLVEIAAAFGLDATECRVVLDVDTFAADVARDGAEARRLGIAGTPAILLGAAPDFRLVAGALSVDELRALVAG